MPFLQTISTVRRRKSAEILNDSLGQYLNGLLDQLKSEDYAEETLHNYLTRLRPIQNYMWLNDIEEYSPDIGLAYYKDYLMRNHPGTVQKREILAAILRLNDYCNGSNHKNGCNIVDECGDDSGEK